jgi:hypothetical protein
MRFQQLFNPPNEVFAREFLIHMPRRLDRCGDPLGVVPQPLSSGPYVTRMS